MLRSARPRPFAAFFLFETALFFELGVACFLENVLGFCFAFLRDFFFGLICPRWSSAHAVCWATGCVSLVYRGRQISTRDRWLEKYRPQALLLAAIVTLERGRRVSCSAGEKTLRRISKLHKSAVSPEEDKIIEIVTNW